jgi:hypothetical protein
MHNKTIRFCGAVSFVSILACAFILTGCHNASGTNADSKPVVATQVAPPFLVTNPPGTGRPATNMPSMDKHSAHGVTCEQCHETAAPTTAPNSNKACLGCHEAGALIKATAKYDDVARKSQNPHESHIHGASCLVCHKNHGESVLYCDECHKPKFGWKVP